MSADEVACRTISQESVEIDQIRRDLREITATVETMAHQILVLQLVVSSLKSRVEK